MNNPIWVMTSAFKSLTLPQIIERTREIQAQGMELCVFRRDGSRKDHVATHLDYESFGPADAQTPARYLPAKPASASPSAPTTT